MNTVKSGTLLALLALSHTSAFAATTFTVNDVTSLTNALASTKTPRVIYLEKGVYDVSDCQGELCGGYDTGRLSFPNAHDVTLAGVAGARRGDVVITAPSSADRRLIGLNKGTLTLTNLTLTCSAGGGIRFGNDSSLLAAADCVFSNLTADAGAVVWRYYSGAAKTVADDYRNCLFADNHATDGAAGCLYARGAVATDCVFSNNTARTNGGAVLSGSYVRCAFVSNSVEAATTSTGGGAIGNDYQSGFCTDCTFVGNSLGGSGHGAAIHQANALTNCVFRGNAAPVNGVVGTVTSEMVGCTFEDNETQSLVESVGLLSRCMISGNKTGALLVSDAAVWANCLVASNRVAKYQGIAKGTFFNCTFVGNYCSSGAVTESIVTGDSTAVNCLFYQNFAHYSEQNPAYLDVALRFADSALTTPLTPCLTNCLWTADMTYAGHTEAALARTQNSERKEAARFHFAESGEHPHALAFGAAARYPGLLDESVRAAVGEVDLAGNPRIENGINGPYITLGCYQYQRSSEGLLLLVR